MIIFVGLSGTLYLFVLEPKVRLEFGVLVFKFSLTGYFPLIRFSCVCTVSEVFLMIALASIIPGLIGPVEARAGKSLGIAFIWLPINVSCKIVPLAPIRH